MTKVLVFPAGETNSLELHDALSTCVNVELYGASSIDRHGEYVFKNYVSGLPLICEDSFLEKFNELLEKHEIDLIFATHDTVALYLAENKDKLAAKLIASDLQTNLICRDKKKTCQLFAGCDFLPRVYETKEGIEEYPVFLKPAVGQGSVGARKIAYAREIQESDFAENVITEYLPGKEFTVDCLTDKEGRLRIAAPRLRSRLLAGICVGGETIELTREILSIAEQINKSMVFRGLWFFQLKEDRQGRLKLLEVSTRCSGTMCLTRARGVNLPLLSIYVNMGLDIEIFLNPYEAVMDRAFVSRYKLSCRYDTVYIDFDDTIIVRGEVNLNAIRFLYQCRNLGKKVVLVTRHEYDLQETMRRYALSPLLFDKIFQLKAEEKKSSVIGSENAIFIDNSYHERKEIFHKCGICVFDVDGIEFLLDWRS